ncbi:TolC family protein [Sorangium atrum]|uniref:TolC family protein n=1 Tax=Sorangium atrum TaxID=2995308 RepID=A0ABT5C605_9BACT|nr:TolC family protein [Sorangium aterium]MDC0681857.1 TolC family protein [Sorangium aterium]
MLHRRLRMVAVSHLAVLALCQGVALAQPAPPQGRPGQQAQARPGQQAPAAAPAAPPMTAAPPAATPQRIEVNDPALAPVPPAARTLASWNDARAMIEQRSVDFAIAVQEVARAEGVARRALAAALPSLDARGDVNHKLAGGSAERLPSDFVPPPEDPSDARQDIEIAPTTLTASLTLRQPVLAPRAWYGIGTARRSVDVARLSLEDRRRITVGAAADAVVSIVTAERVSEINRVGLRSALERLELTRRRERLGTGTKLDVVRAEQDVALARATLVSGDEALRKAREALGAVLGERGEVGVPQGFSLNAIAAEVQSQCAEARSDQRADVRAARAELEIAERNLTDAKLAFAPNVDLSSTLSAQTSLGDESTHRTRSWGWSIGAVLTVPLWDGGARYGDLEINRAVVEQQRVRLGAVERTAGLETTQAVRGVAVAEQARAVAEQSRDLARETARLTQVAFEAGTATSFDLVESGRRQREAELDLAVKEFEVVKAKITALLSSASCR